MKPINCKIQNHYTQTGVGDDIVFMWQYGEGSYRQSAYKIDIYDNNELVYSTDKVLSDKQNNIKIEANFTQQKEYSFIVSVWDENDYVEQSDNAYFITGVRNWSGEWIGNHTKKPFIARKTFYADKTTKAVLSVCVPGQFEVKINGEKINSYAYEGSQTDFNKRVHYSTYDVGIKKGQNEITIEVANGWYIGDNDDGRRYFYTMNMGYQPFGDMLTVIAQLKICDEYIVTDSTWQVSPSKTMLADIYGSEDIDNTIEYDWSAAKVASPPKGGIATYDYPPVIRKYCYEPKKIDKDKMIFDFGQNMTSQFYLRIKGEKGKKIKLIPAEKLSVDGNIEQTVDTYSILTLSGDEDIFEQKFSVNGARWYKIEGADYSQVIEFKSYFVTSSAQDCGYFHCSDEKLNKIYGLILKAIESNINHSHTDCPTIEKLGWLEPNHLMAHSIMYNKDVNMLWSKIAADMRDAQYLDDEFDVDNSKFKHEYKSGLIPSIAPRYAKFLFDGGEGSFWDIIPWGSSIILAAYEQYKFYANTEVLADNYNSAKRYIGYLTQQYNVYNRLYDNNDDVRFICAGLGDWGIEQNKGRSRENIETAFYYHDLVIMAEISKILDKDDTNEFIKQAERVKELYNKTLLVTGKDTAYYKDYITEERTQANQAIPLCFNLVPADKIEQVQSSLIEECEGKHLECGEIGLLYIIRALSNAGRNDIIYSMILKDTHPSYFRFVETGETTLPEFWRDDARSRNHDMMGHIMEWFFKEVAGIKSDDGFNTVTVSPWENISEVTCKYNSINGMIELEKKNGNITVKKPSNVQVK